MAYRGPVFIASFLRVDSDISQCCVLALHWPVMILPVFKRYRIVAAPVTDAGTLSEHTVGRLFLGRQVPW